MKGGCHTAVLYYEKSKLSSAGQRSNTANAEEAEVKESEQYRRSSNMKRYLSFFSLVIDVELRSSLI